MSKPSWPLPQRPHPPQALLEEVSEQVLREAKHSPAPAPSTRGVAAAAAALGLGVYGSDSDTESNEDPSPPPAAAAVEKKPFFWPSRLPRPPWLDSSAAVPAVSVLTTRAGNVLRREAISEQLTLLGKDGGVCALQQESATSLRPTSPRHPSLFGSAPLQLP